MKHSRVILGLLAVGATLIALGTATCLRAGLVCESTTDGNGMFTYTFTNDATTFVWGLDNGDYIGIQSHGIEQIITPPSWTTAVDEVGYVTFHHTNGIFYIEDTPLVFQIESHFTESITYTNGDQVAEFFQGGWISAYAYSKGTHSPLSPGFQQYDLLGPKPEPQFDKQTFSNSTREMTISLSELAGSTCIVHYATWPTGPGWQTITNFPVTGYTTNFIYTVPVGTNFGFLKYECLK